MPLEKTQVKSEGGVIIADNDQVGLGGSLKRLRGKVIKTGSLVQDVDLKKDGTVILFEEYAGIAVDSFNPDIVWMEEDQVVAIETEE